MAKEYKYWVCGKHVSKALNSLDNVVAYVDNYPSDRKCDIGYFGNTYHCSNPGTIIIRSLVVK